MLVTLNALRLLGYRFKVAGCPAGRACGKSVLADFRFSMARS
jgi:hypothetical protein